MKKGGCWWHKVKFLKSKLYSYSLKQIWQQAEFPEFLHCEERLLVMTPGKNMMGHSTVALTFGYFNQGRKTSLIVGKRLRISCDLRCVSVCLSVCLSVCVCMSCKTWLIVVERLRISCDQRCACVIVCVYVCVCLRRGKRHRCLVSDWGSIAIWVLLRLDVCVYVSMCPCLCLCVSRTQAHTHAHIHAYTHTHIHTYTHT